MSFYKVKKYPDGSFYTIISEFPKSFVYKINSYEDLWILKQIKDVYEHNNKNATITIPCLFDAQADKRFNDNESSGLKLVCNFINEMKWEKVEIFHPHNPEVVESLIDNVKIIDNTYYIINVLQSIKNEDKIQYPDIIDDIYIGQKGLYRDSRLDENLLLMSSDAGGFKPLMKLCDKIQWKGETISASKSRSYNPVTNKSELTQILNVKDLQGKDILIVDDICVYGGTFKGLAKILRTKNCGKLYLAVSHMSLENPDSELLECFDKIFTTNSKFNQYFPIPVDGGFNQSNKLKVITLF